MAVLDANEIKKENITQENISTQVENGAQEKDITPQEDKTKEEKTNEENTENIDNIESVEISINQEDIPQQPAIINEALYLELQVLYTNYSQRTDANDENLLLIGQTARQIKNNDGAGIRESYEKFITQGLINDCNELGLSLLIEQIKVCIF